MKKLLELKVCVAIFVLGILPPATAEEQGAFGKVIRVDRSAFQPDAGIITFAEFKQGTQNPVYRPEHYGGAAGGVTVAFGGFFQGQQIASASVCPKGAARTGCLDGLPGSPLALDQSAPVTYVEHDGSNPSSPALSGSPKFNGPVSMLFSTDVAGVGLAGGFFNSHEATAIRAFDRSGRMIGGVRNLELGMEYMALVTVDGMNQIAGLQFSLVGAEGAGFAIDDVTVARIEQIDQSQVPGLLAKPSSIPPRIGSPGVLSLHELVPGDTIIAPTTPGLSLRDLGN